MALVMILVLVAGLTAAGVWWRLARAEDPAGSTGFERGGADGADPDFFVLSPSGSAPPREDRPPPAVSIVRIVLTIALTTALVVAVTAAITLLIKGQLDRYFRLGD